jgi:hypothetical protein
MDYEPKTRKEKKGGKYKEIFNKKTVRAKEALLSKYSTTPQVTKKK